MQWFRQKRKKRESKGNKTEDTGHGTMPYLI